MKVERRKRLTAFYTIHVVSSSCRPISTTTAVSLCLSLFLSLSRWSSWYQRYDVGGATISISAHFIFSHSTLLKRWNDSTRPSRLSVCIPLLLNGAPHRSCTLEAHDALPAHYALVHVVMVMPLGKAEGKHSFCSSQFLKWSSRVTPCLFRQLKAILT